MGNLQRTLITALVVTVVVLVSLLLILSMYGKKLRTERVEEKALMCYACEARKNYPEEEIVVVAESISSNINSNSVSSFTSEGARRRYSADIDECLNNPKFQRQCETGQYCAVLHQKLNEVERVVRSCSTGGKLGCNSEIISGVKEKSCFCNSDLCMQVPFFYEDK